MRLWLSGVRLNLVAPRNPLSPLIVARLQRLGLRSRLPMMVMLLFLSLVYSHVQIFLDVRIFYSLILDLLASWLDVTYLVRSDPFEVMGMLLRLRRIELNATEERWSSAIGDAGGRTAVANIE